MTKKKSQRKSNILWAVLPSGGRNDPTSQPGYSTSLSSGTVQNEPTSRCRGALRPPRLRSSGGSTCSCSPGPTAGCGGYLPRRPAFAKGCGIGWRRVGSWRDAWIRVSYYLFEGEAVSAEKNTKTKRNETEKQRHHHQQQRERKSKTKHIKTTKTRTKQEENRNITTTAAAKKTKKHNKT